MAPSRTSTALRSVAPPPPLQVRAAAGQGQRTPLSVSTSHLLPSVLKQICSTLQTPSTKLREPTKSSLLFSRDGQEVLPLLASAHVRNYTARSLTPGHRRVPGITRTWLWRPPPFWQDDWSLGWLQLT